MIELLLSCGLPRAPTTNDRIFNATSFAKVSPSRTAGQIPAETALRGKRAVT